MGALALAYESDPQYQDMCEYLSTEKGFWIQNDIWKGSDAAFKEAGVDVNKRVWNWTIADFSYFENRRLKNEIFCSVAPERRFTFGVQLQYELCEGNEESGEGIKEYLHIVFS